MEEKRDSIKRIGLMLKSFNETFEIEAHIDEDDGELVASGLKIKELKTDGKDFVGILYDTFNSIIQMISDEHEVIFNEDKEIEFEDYLDGLGKKYENLFNG